MNNITYSDRFSPNHDNGERSMCWKKGNTPEYNGTYIITTIFEDTRPFRYMDGIWYDEIHTNYAKENIVAYMKLPTPYKPD